MGKFEGNSRRRPNLSMMAALGLFSLARMRFLCSLSREGRNSRSLSSFQA